VTPYKGFLTSAQVLLPQHFHTALLGVKGVLSCRHPGKFVAW